MEHNTNRILWTVLVLVIGVALYITFRPAVNGLLGQSIEKIQDVTTNVHGDTNDNSSSHADVKPNLLINASSSATNGQTKFQTMQGASTDIDGVYSRTDSYEQVTTPSYKELYYRFMYPETNNLYGLTPGTTYTLSGSASHTSGELEFRAEYSTNGTEWSNTYFGDLGIPVSDGSTFTPFSYTFTVPADATGIYVSLQNYNYNNGDFFRFKDMKLVKD